MHDHEIIPGVALNALGMSERLMIGALRMIGAGRGKCPNLSVAFESHLGSQGAAGAQGASMMTFALCAESRRKLTLGWFCVRGVTWDEAAILAMLEAALRAEPREIALWLGRLGIDTPSPALQRGIAWTAAAFCIADKAFDPDVGRLTRASTSATAHVRDQIESQFGDRWG